MISYSASSIVNEYRRKKKYELEFFIKKNCKDCKKRNTDLCKITRNIEGKLQCVYKE